MNINDVLNFMLLLYDEAEICLSSNNIIYVLNKKNYPKIKYQYYLIFDYVILVNKNNNHIVHFDFGEKENNNLLKKEKIAFDYLKTIDMDKYLIANNKRIITTTKLLKLEAKNKNSMYRNIFAIMFSLLIMMAIMSGIGNFLIYLIIVIILVII